MRPDRLLLTCCVAFGLACDAPTEPGTPDAFIAVTRRQLPDPLQSYVLDAGDRTVSIAGHIITSDPCHGFAATATRFDRRLVVTLHARRNGSGCLQPAGEWNYRITVPGVPAGEWRVAVRHSFAAGTVAETVLDSAVVVPGGR